MSVPYTINHIPLKLIGRRPGIVRVPKTLTIHSTGNPRSTARNERSWLTNPANLRPQTGWHVVVDEREAIEAIPLNEVAWHAGDGGSGEGNRFSIGVEICESGNRAKTLSNAAQVVAKLLEDNGLTMSDIRQHHDWSGKNCPRILRTGTLWQEFLAAVEAHFKNEEPADPLAEAVAVLLQAGVIGSPEHWLTNARPGRTVRGEVAAALIIKMAGRLRM